MNSADNIYKSLYVIMYQCVVMVWSTGQNQLDIIAYAAPGNSAHTVELGRCDDDSILTDEAFLVQIDARLSQVGDECDITPTFAEFCEATVRCSFTQTEFRAAVGDLCSADYDQAQINVFYNCLPGTRQLTRA